MNSELIAVFMTLNADLRVLFENFKQSFRYWSWRDVGLLQAIIVVTQIIWKLLGLTKWSLWSRSFDEYFVFFACENNLWLINVNISQRFPCVSENRFLFLTFKLAYELNISERKIFEKKKKLFWFLLISRRFQE